MNKTLELNEGQKAVLKDLAKGMMAKSGTSIASLGYSIQMSSKLANVKIAKAEAEIKEHNDTLAPKLADEKNRQTKAELKTSIDDIKTATYALLDKNMQAKRNSVEKYTMSPIPDDMFRQLQALNMRSDTISDYEWSILNKTFATNYQASMIFAGIAEKHNVTILPAWSPVKCKENLDAFEEMARIAIKHIDNPYENLYAMSFLSDKPNENLSKLIEDIDSDMATIIPAERRTVIDRLKVAGQKAHDKDNFGLYYRIQSFIERNISELASPEEMKDALFEQAESLISEGMDASGKA